MSDGAIGGGRVAAFAAGDSHPEVALRRSALAIADALGTMLAGCRELSASAARRAALAMGAGEARLYGSTETAGIVPAALANGVAASALDLDDGHTLGGSIHPGAAIVPALLAVAEPDAPLHELIVANLVGYEVSIRAGYLLWPEDRSYQAHMAGTPAAIGGAIACARLRGLDQVGLRRALEIGAAHTPLAALQFPQVKESLGWAAATAAAAALLAEAGFKEAGAGGDEAFGYGPHPPTPFDRLGSDNAFVGTLGEGYEIERTYFKPYGACRFVHTAADALLRIIADTGVTASQIATIEVATHREAAYLDRQLPTAIEEAQYSFPFALAALALRPDDFPLRITQSVIGEEAAIELASRITVLHDPALDRYYPDDYPSRVRLETRSGEVFEQEEVVAWGSPDKPISEADLRRKLEAMVAPALGESAGGAIFELLEAPGDVRIGDLLALLEPPPATA